MVLFTSWKYSQLQWTETLTPRRGTLYRDLSSSPQLTSLFVSSRLKCALQVSTFKKIAIQLRRTMENGDLHEEVKQAMTEYLLQTA